MLMKELPNVKLVPGRKYAILIIANQY